MGLSSYGDSAAIKKKKKNFSISITLTLFCLKFKFAAYTVFS